MAYEISIDHTPNYLHVSVSGQATFDDISGVWKDIAQACKEFNCSNVLRDGVLQGRASILDIYRVSNRMDDFDLPPRLRVAYVCEDTIRPRLDFYETVIANRVAGVTIRNFTNRIEAERWLAEEQCGCQSAQHPINKI